MQHSMGMRQMGGMLVLGTVLSLVGVTAWAEENPAKAEKDEQKAILEKGVPSWINWLNAGLPFDFELTGLDVEGGYRAIGGGRSSAKFQEYRVLQESPYFDHAAASLETRDKKRYVELYTFDSFKNDQSYDLRTGKYGDYELEIFWDQIPHVLSTTGRTAFSTTRNDHAVTLTLPPDAPRDNPSADVLTDFLNQRAAPVNLEFTTRKGGLGLKYNLTESWDLGVRYTYTDKNGTIPFGAGLGADDQQIIELPAPFFNRTHLAEAKVQYARPGWNVGLGYTGSFFNQSVKTITFDNPLGNIDSTELSSRGLTTMDPSNQAHNVFLSGGLSLPLRTRITGKFAYGWRFQNDPFVGFTVNPVLSTDPQLVLPRKSLNGDVRTTLVTFNATSRPFALPLTLYGGYRFYDFDDRSPEIVFPAHVTRDLGPPEVETKANAPFSFTKHNAHLDAGYPLLGNLNLRLGYAWERWERDPKQREVPTSDEQTLKSSLDYSPADWLLLRAAYRRGWRNISNYNTAAHEGHVAQDIEGGVFNLQSPDQQSILLRKFDLTNRTRDRVELLATITPLQALDFTVTYSLLQDEFDKSRPPQVPFNDSSPLGLQSSRGWSLAGDLTYSPFSWLSFFVNYTREEFRYNQLSRSRPDHIDLGTPPAPLAPGCVSNGTPNTAAICDFPDFNWRSVNTDTINTYGVGADVILIPKRLNFKLTWSFSDADTIIRSFNPVTPSSAQPVGPGGSPAPADQQSAATAVNFPTDKTKLHTLIAALRYKLTENWSLKGEYRWERFRETNWQTDTINLTGLGSATPPANIGTDVFLGARFLQNYDAHIAAFTLRYQF